MEENPNSGSSEDFNKPQTDLGSLNLDLDSSTASENQEKDAGGGPFPEAEQTSTESSVALATTTWPAVGQQEDGVTWTASLDESETNFPEPYLDSGHIMDSDTDLVETNEPLVGETWAEGPAMRTDSFFDGDPFSMEKTEEEKQETEESFWANVEPYEKVETRDVKFREVDCTEKFQERDCDSESYSKVDHYEALAKTDHETLKSTEAEVVRDSEHDDKQPETTVVSYFPDFGPEFNEVAVMQEENKRDAENVVNIGSGCGVSDCATIECRFETDKGLGLWSQDNGTVCVNDFPATENVAINCAQENEMANLMGLANVDVREKPTGEFENPVCGEELCCAEEPGKETEDHSHTLSESNIFAGECQATFIPFEKDIVLQPSSHTDNANLNNSWLGTEEDKFVDGEAFFTADKFDTSFSFSEVLQTDPWQTNWDPTVNDSCGFSNQVNGNDNWPFPPTEDSVDGNMENPWPSFNEKWCTEDMGGLDNSWEAMGITPSHQNQEAPLRQESSGEQSNISSFGPNKEIGRPLVLFKMGNSRNASTESSASPKDNETNSSDLSEDEIANRRYGLLYQEIEADKEEAPGSAFNGFTQDTSLFSMQSSQNVGDNMVDTEEAPSLEVQAEEAPRAAETADTTVEPEVQPEEAAGEPAADTVDAVESGDKETPGHDEKECELQMDSVIEDVGETEGVDVTPAKEGGEVVGIAATGVQDSDIPPIEEKAGESQENLSNIPSVVIEPASNNEGDGEDHEVLVNESKDTVEDPGTQGTEGIASETSEAVKEPKSNKDVQPASSEEQPASTDDGMPPGFLYKVEVLHDFEAANSDELNLQRGESVLVIPSAAADQEAGWITGIRESDWLQYRDLTSYKGLFPENFIRRLE